MTTPTASELDRFSALVLANADSYRQEFTTALPFRHICIDNFLEEQFAERLLAEFPSFDRKLATTELGEVGGKAVNTKIREISPAYRDLYTFISSQPFLDFVSHLSGIPDLLIDPKMYGGGTHENRHGQDLDPHIDFNYEDRGLHRRLNLIIYLNKGWKTEWGGAIEIHSNPRRPEENRIRAFDPLFNRAVMFETNEISWHGFPGIYLPESDRHRSRKSLSIYLYTKERPAGEVAPSHGTFYVQRQLRDHFKPGRVLNDGDLEELNEMLTRRDRWIEFYQKMELDKNRTIDDLNRYVSQLQSNSRMPLTGYVIQEGAASGVHGDGWIASAMKMSVRPVEPMNSITLQAFRPDPAGGGRLRVLVDDTEAVKTRIQGGISQVSIPVKRGKDETFSLEILFEGDQKWEPEGDTRDLAFVISEMRAEHPSLSASRKSRLFKW